MISFAKKLWRDRRGNVLLIMAGALPLLFGSAGLASDTIQWALWKRQLQRTADSAAMAGVYAKVAQENLGAAVDNDIAKNNLTGIALSNKQVTEPTIPTYTSAVNVNLSVQKSLPFAAMFLTATPTISAQATAALVKEGNYCVVALNNTTSPSIIINGNITVNMGCGMISNSTSTSSSQANAAIAVTGNSHIVHATPIAAAGSLPSVNGDNTETPYQLKQGDPYAGKYDTNVPAGMPCSTLAQQIASANATTADGFTIINPGCYQKQGMGNNAATQAFTTSNQNIALNPGTYYINNADFAIGANSNLKVNSTNMQEGVTIILTGSTPGKVDISSNATVNLRAPSSGAYSKMLFIQKAGATAASSISGNSSSAYDGTFYFPSTEVHFTGTTSDTFKCAMIVSYIVQFSGNTNVQNNTTGCYANQTTAIEKVRLVG